MSFARAPFARARRLLSLSGVVAAGLAALFVPRLARAANDPSLEWWTLKTPRFHVHYDRRLEAVALRVAAVAESVHTRLAPALGWEPSEPVEIVLTDNTDDANGSATPIPFATIRLFVTAPDDLSPLSDYDDWYLDLITHEHTHILHTDQVSGVPALFNALFGKTVAPNQAQPRWVLEGLAVVAESAHSSAGRMRSTLYDMYVRADVLAGTVPGLDQLSNGARRWPQGNLFYLYGSRFLGWIADVYGANTLRAVAADYGAQVVPWGINRSIRRATGRTYEELYEGWKDHLLRTYTAQAAEVRRRGVREGVRLTRHGEQVFYPRFVPRAARRAPQIPELVYFRADGVERSGLYRMTLGRGDGAGAGSTWTPGKPELWARTAGVSSAAFEPDGALLFHSVAPHRNFYQRNDLFRLPPGARAPSGHERVRRKLTNGLRAAFADVSPDGRRVVFTVNDAGTTTLHLAELRPDGGLGRRTVLASGAPFDQVFTPRFSPDGAHVAYSVWSVGGFRDLCLVEVRTRKVERLTFDRALDTNPAWSPDGRTLYFGSDRSGIPNIYALDLATRQWFQVTNVITGATQPAVSEDGRTLVYVGYTAAGFDLHAMELDRDAWLAAPPPPEQRPAPPAVTLPDRVERYPYRAWPTLRPRAWSLRYEPGYFGHAFTLRTAGQDVVGHHGASASLVLETGAPSPRFALGYAYGRLPFDFGSTFFHAISPRQDYRFSDREDVYVEDTYGWTNGIFHGVAGEFDFHGMGLSYTIARSSADLPVGAEIDPYARPTVDPASGTLGILHLGYSYSNVEGGLHTAGPARGFYLGLSADVASQALGGDETLQALNWTASTYVPMPWPGHQTLALRLAGGLAAGSYPRRGLYYVGGYDTEAPLVDVSGQGTIQTGVYNGAFVLRGYPPFAYAGTQYHLVNAEYRIPIAGIDRGPSTLPIFLNRVSGNLFFDYGGALDRFEPHRIRLFYDGALVHAPDLHTGLGAELWIELTLGYHGGANLRLGYARGLAALAIPGGQFYLVASAGF